jgi:hypothetical protein
MIKIYCWKKLKIHPIKPYAYRYIKLNTTVHEIPGCAKVATNARVDVLGEQRHPALTDIHINCENSSHYLVKITPGTQTQFSMAKKLIFLSRVSD